jgi:uncharacterized phiE125 gp8 family phage protein
MKYNIVTPASDLPVSVADMKTHLRVTHSNHDNLIESYIKSAVQMIENRASLCLMPQTWKLSLTDEEVVEKIEIYKYPVLGFVNITYYDTDNASQSLTNSQDDYISFIDGRPSSLIFEDVPTTYEREDAMQITFLAGYDTIPEDLLLGVKMLVWRMYNHPDDPVNERFSFVDRIVRDYRAWQ